MLFYQFDIINILVGICSIIACAVIIIREACPDTKLNYSKFAINGPSCGKMVGTIHVLKRKIIEQYIYHSCLHARVCL